MERVLFKNRLFLFTGGADIGATFIADEYEYESCDTAFCDFPNTSWVLSPGVKAIYLSGSFITLFVAARGTLYSGDKESTFPFNSGVAFSFGFQIN